MKILSRIALAMVMFTISCLSQERIKAVYQDMADFRKENGENVENARMNHARYFNVFACIGIPIGNEVIYWPAGPYCPIYRDIYANSFGVGMRVRIGEGNGIKYGGQVTLLSLSNKTYHGYGPYDYTYVLRGVSTVMVMIGPGAQYFLPVEILNTTPYIDLEIPNLVSYMGKEYKTEYRIGGGLGVGVLTSLTPDIGVDLSVYYYYNDITRKNGGTYVTDSPSTKSFTFADPHVIQVKLGISF